jgi:hypothetical protein
VHLIERDRDIILFLVGRTAIAFATALNSTFVVSSSAWKRFCFCPYFWSAGSGNREKKHALLFKHYEQQRCALGTSVNKLGAVHYAIRLQSARSNVVG